MICPKCSGYMIQHLPNPLWVKCGTCGFCLLDAKHPGAITGVADEKEGISNN